MVFTQDLAKPSLAWAHGHIRAVLIVCLHYLPPFLVLPRLITFLGPNFTSPLDIILI